MKKLLALFTTLIVSLSIHAAQFKEGEYYKVLDRPHSENPKVMEFFSFYCPHCNAFEPIVEKLAAQLPKGTEFQRVHVSFMGGNMAHSMSKAYATMVSLNVEDKMVPVMFDRIHNKRRPPQNDEALKQIFTDEGIDAKSFDNAFNSFAVDSMVRRFDKTFEESGLTGVPALIVNNKYLVQPPRNIKTEEYFELVDYLLKK
ncbi:thiol:disulfide interchange protein DsbA/DsbL [Vibrio ruber]|uniref:Thiol:disulfide interchange protein n=1 Tax=Vibrio ruber (strain DSM 16370 / JCM 11486 / BCRC 17186 / CECT 7878 / LMG 23124 / VR1) TaxID=1123498 RepID=A0A1R4LJB5_VIBR1|nr:thiol:disulfide interchange protein DsbA/DsbL [Vibrio ruber]WNJ96631.1 thiol:disulfide interchange protein DsbA/DsbL [Vibrio ruber]SJN56588.1 Thiol:disulfide interchange protein DsbA precursor [Vibrio ruber DSM 16370]